jgi:electron transport complex protein RnfA
MCRSGTVLSNRAYTALGAAVGFSLVMVLFAAMRERIVVADVPVPFRGAAITLIDRRIDVAGVHGFFRSGARLINDGCRYWR